MKITIPIPVSPLLLSIALLLALPLQQCLCSAWTISLTDRSYFLKEGTVMGFVDFNGDRFTDIILLDQSGTTLTAALFHKDSSELKFLLQFSGGDRIRSVIVGDFNGDSLVDLMLLVALDAQQGPYTAYLSLHGADHHANMTNPVLVATFRNVPLALDYNADGIMDILGEGTSSASAVWLGQQNGNMSKEPITSLSAPWGRPGYSAFVDALSEFRPGVFLSLADKYAFYANIEGKLDFASPKNVDFPPGAVVLGAPLFDDWYGIGKAKLLVPYCKDAACAQSAVSIYDFVNDKWVDASVTWGEWQLVLSSSTGSKGLASVVALPSLLPARAGDINLDRFPDVLTVLQKGSNTSARVAAVLVSEGGQNKFTVMPLFDIATGVEDVVFFDANEDSVLDFISMRVTAEGQTALQLHVQTSDAVDAYFLKVMVLTGRCAAGNCASLPSDQKLPYGLPVPGATLQYLTEGVQGGKQYGMAMLSSSSSYQALQLPFHVFGLGYFANYIEDLILAMPTPTASIRQHDFNFIVPKTQVVIIPHPLDQPSKWKYLLFIDPFHDRKVIFVAVALLSVALVVVVIICILQYFEYREDKMEKLKEIQKFSFDAM